MKIVNKKTHVIIINVQNIASVYLHGTIIPATVIQVKLFLDISRELFNFTYLFLGFVGVSCESVCDTNPCENHGTCIEDRKSLRGYHCQCNSSMFSGMYSFKGLNVYLFVLKKIIFYNK